MARFDDIWYGHSALVWPLLPLSALYCVVAGIRRQLYRSGLKAVHKLDVPVIVVGNITVGGTGKTPLVTWLVRFLRAQGYSPGLVARGYGGNATQWPQAVTRDSDPEQVGDEPVCLVRACDCPMLVGPDRVAAARALLAAHNCDVIVSDDGLQHYALARDVEIAVIDGARRFGNGWCLPAGPLRESKTRLAQVDLLVGNGAAQAGEYAMQVQAHGATHLLSGEQRSLDSFRDAPVHAVAGIGHPERFFAGLRALGLTLETQALPDHHAYRGTEVTVTDKPVLMTEKDAVKWRPHARDNDWSVGTRIELPAAFGEQLLVKLSART